METMYVTMRIDFENNGNCSKEEIAEMVCKRANSHNGTIEEGVEIDNIEFCGMNY